MFQKKFEIYYKPPGRDEHISVAQALDELFHRLERVEFLLKNSQKPENP